MHANVKRFRPLPVGGRRAAAKTRSGSNWRMLGSPISFVFSKDSASLRLLPVERNGQKAETDPVLSLFAVPPCRRLMLGSHR